MPNLPSPISRPTEYVSALTGAVLIALIDAGVEIADKLLISLPVVAALVTTGLVAFFGSRVESAPEVEGDPDPG